MWEKAYFHPCKRPQSLCGSPSWLLVLLAVVVIVLYINVACVHSVCHGSFWALPVLLPISQLGLFLASPVLTGLFGGAPLPSQLSPLGRNPCCSIQLPRCRSCGSASWSMSPHPHCYCLSGLLASLCLITAHNSRIMQFTSVRYPSQWFPVYLQSCVNHHHNQF